MLAIVLIVGSQGSIIGCIVHVEMMNTTGEGQNGTKDRFTTVAQTDDFPLNAVLLGCESECSKGDTWEVIQWNCHG